MSRLTLDSAAIDRPRRAPADLRLALPAVACWLAVLWGLGRSPGPVLGAGLLAIALTVLAGLAGRRSGRWYPVAAGCFQRGLERAFSGFLRSLDRKPRRLAHRAQFWSVPLPSG